ncbi:AAA family ATPase [Bosea sp. CCNWLW174]|uniref:AAA family ATPase n=1 Tax=unclassified Bosea (in: a-proteobacteria) TaxID=2653178 RepID=UPI003014621A
MKLTALRLHNVRRFAGTGVRIENIGDGINVLCAANEHGKSTCFDALHALFFQPHTGTPGSVQALRPYSGGNPLVEADLTTADGAFRLTKQFYGGRRAQVRERDSGRLIAQADEAERFISALVKGGISGPAGLLWVRQGVTGIERRAKAEDETERRARETVLTSVQGEVEALTGGRRMTEALAACEEELLRLVTATGRPKTGGPYASAIDESEQLAEQERRLGAEVADLRAALDRRRTIRERLAEIDTPEMARERQAALAEAEAELSAAKAQAESLKAAESKAALALNRRVSAEQALSGFRQALARFASLRDAEAGAAQERDAARARHQGAAGVVREAATAVESAEREEREQRDLLARLERALRAQEAARRLATARDSEREAQATREQIERMEATLKSLILPAGKIAELEEIDGQLLQLQARAEARAPHLRIDYAAGAEGRISIAGVVLAQAEERPLAGTTQIEIPAIGLLTVTAPQAEEVDRSLARAKAKRKTLLDELQLDSLAAARQREVQARDLKADLDLARRRLQLFAPGGLAALQEQIARLEAEAASADEVPADLDAARRQLGTVEARVGAMREAARAAQARTETSASALVEAERHAAGLSSARAALAESLGPETQWRGREERLAAEHAETDLAWQATQRQVEELAARRIDLAAAEARQLRLRTVMDAAREEITRLREEAAGLDGRIQTRTETAIEEAWQETRDRLAQAQRRTAVLAREVAILTRLRGALEAARSQARDHYFAPVLQELRPLLGLLFDDASVTFDEDTLLPRSVLRNGLDEQVGVLSGGMREQLAILTRLAFARLLAKGGQPTPVILDDALVYSDDDRIEKMFDALHRQASAQQVIVFSCRQRAFARLGGSVLRMEPWQPEH